MTDLFYVRVEAPAEASGDRVIPTWGEFMQEINDLAARGYRIAATITHGGMTVAVIMGRAE